MWFQDVPITHEGEKGVWAGRTKFDKFRDFRRRCRCLRVANKARGGRMAGRPRTVASEWHERKRRQTPVKTFGQRLTAGEGGRERETAAHGLRAQTCTLCCVQDVHYGFRFACEKICECLRTKISRV